MVATEISLNVLVCDDDPVDRKLVKAYVQKIEDRVIKLKEAGNTSEILEMLRTEKIDLVLMDIQMPDRSGLEWLDEIVQMRKIPVIMLTGQGNEEVAVEAMMHGASGYITKSSLCSEKLRDTIDSAMKKWNCLQEEEMYKQELESMANIDPLTGLFNRRALMRLLKEQMEHARYQFETFSIIMMDIDLFKNVNDEYGHITGDNVIVKIAETLGQNVRKNDIIGRYGGDEFLILLPRADASVARLVAERLRTAIATSMMVANNDAVFSVTVSQGVSNYEWGEPRTSFIARADEMLYRAKNNNRNRVEVSYSTIVSGVELAQ